MQTAQQARQRATASLDAMHTKISPDKGAVYDKLGEADSLADSTIWHGVTSIF